MDIYSKFNLYWAIYSYKGMLVVDSKGTTVEKEGVVGKYTSYTEQSS
jgi:hypothetical protein